MIHSIAIDLTVDMKSYAKSTLITLGVLAGVILLFLIGSALLPNTDTAPIPPSHEVSDHGLGLNPPAPMPTTPGVAVGAGCVLSFGVKPTINSSAGTIGYAVTLKNSGNSTCKNTSYSFYYGENESYVSASPKPTASDYYWRVGSLAPNAKWNANISMKFLPNINGTDVRNEACATADNAKADACADNTISMNAAGTAPSPAPVLLPNTEAGDEYGVWEWTTPTDMTSSQMDSIVSSAKAHKFNVIYLTIDDYLEIAALPAGSAKDTKTQSYMNTLNAFVTKAKAQGIAVDAEGGSRDWADAENKWKGFALIDFVGAYNQKYPGAKIRKFQYDVESYLKSSYEENKATVLASFVAFIDQSMTRMQNVDAGFSVVVPHFYDSTQEWTPSVTYNGKKAHTFTHLLSILGRKPGSDLIIMAYRNFFSGGGDGVRELSTPELVEASADGNKTNIIIAQETGNIDPSYVTFYGKTRADLLNMVSTITKNFGSYSAFNGVAIDYLDPFLELK
jgi:hypothetical protein